MDLVLESSYFQQVISSFKYALFVHHTLQQELLSFYHIVLE